jgi:hypothetical protein
MSVSLGERYGRLVVVADAGRQRRSRLYLCRCDCGNETRVLGYNLSAGRTRSCGCLHREELARRNVATKTVHGHASRGRPSPTHSSWAAMLYRCTSPGSKDWPRYGGVGVEVCHTWRRFEEFLLDMGERPPGTSIDRIDPYGNYTPSNCRWATPSEQNRNRRARGWAA